MSNQKKKSKRKVYPASYKLKLVKLHEEEDYSYQYLCEQTGVGHSSLTRWVSLYRKEGPNCFKEKRRVKKAENKTLQEAPAVREKIIEIKEEYPVFGIQRISDLLKRVFFLKASPETVRKTLHQEEMMPEKPRKKPKKKPQKPRFFERSTPNQMWQTDIFSFRLGGRAAYLLGFIDDYSRYIVGLGLYRSQTAENLLETYRRSVGEYGLPSEMLTDNGRQYTNWRGTTRFEKELQKDRIKHIKSQPHHPMTLGKIERFWKTIWDEFLNRCQFDSLETAQERIALWIKYYNHRRPHQGIGGLCPADRFFEIDSKLREVVEKGVEENALELALRGKPKESFYMVGRMNGQSVVLEAEKGELKLSVDERLDGKLKEEVNNEKTNSDSAENIRIDSGEETPQETGETLIYRRTEVPGSSEPVELESERSCHLPGSRDQLQPTGQVADASLRSNGGSAEAESQGVQSDSFESKDPEITGTNRADSVSLIEEGVFDEQQPRSQSPNENECDNESPESRNNSNSGRGGTGDQPQDLLRMGEPGSFESSQNSLGSTGRTTGERAQPLCGRAGEQGQELEPTGSDAGTGTGNTRHSARRTSPRIRRVRHPFRSTKKSSRSRSEKNKRRKEKKKRR